MELDYQKIDFDLPKNQSNVIKVIGVGGYRWLNIQYEEKIYWVHASLAQLIE